MIRVPAKAMTALAILSCVLFETAHAIDPLPVETRLVSAASAPVATQLAFNIPAAEDLVITLTDLLTPAAMASAGVVVTQGAAVAASAQLAAPATTATAALPAAVGDYTLYVIGVPGTGFSVGTFAVCVAPKASPSNCIQSASLSGNLTAQSSANDPTVSTFTATLVVTSGGSYTFNFQDLQFPEALATPPEVALFQGSATVQLGITAGSAVTLSPGTYTLLAIAQADQSTKAGVFGITIGAPSATPLLDAAVGVGSNNSTAPFENPTAQAVTLKVTDYGFPGPLAGTGALLTSGGTALVTASASGGTASIAAPAGDLKVWTYATAGATAGTFSADVSSASADLFTSAQGVQVPGSTFAYAFVTPALAAGSYQATAADLQFPSTLAGLSFAAAQNGTILQQSATAASVNINAVAGNVVLLVAAQTPASGSVSGNGLFDVSLQTTDASAQLVYDRTQGVSSTNAFFDAQTLNIGTSGSFDASLTDLGFPAQFGNLALVVSRGPQVLGKIFGGGVFSFPGTAGVYQLNFIATPAAQQQFGLYGVSVVYTKPTVTLTSNVSSAATNSLVTLNWTANNADSCAATGGSWTGDKNASSGSETVTLSATTTFTLTCTGPGGEMAQSVTVSAVAAASSGGGGGGGAIDLGVLAIAAALTAANIRRRATASRLGRNVF